MRDEEYFAIKDRAAARLLHIPHVTGVGVGGRERNGQPTGEIVIKVFVLRKKPLSEIPPEEVIPASFEGVPTDVVELGPSRLRSGDPVGVVNPHLLNFDENTDPLRGGMSLRVAYHMPAQGPGGDGTLGCILRDKHDGSAIYGLTNHHVVTPKGGKLSRSRNALQRYAPNASLFDKFGIVTAGANDKRRDAAVVRLSPGQKWLPAIKQIGFVTGKHTVTVDEAATGTYRVRKHGARTGLTYGVVIALDVMSNNGNKIGDMLVQPLGGPPLPPDKPVFFSYFGDSGSVVVNEQNQIVALLYAGDDVDPLNASETRKFSLDYVTPIETVLHLFAQVERLDLEIAVAGANPTDASELKTVPPPAGAPVMTVAQVTAQGDPAYRRPLLGGLQLLASPMLGVPNATTLGCIVTDQNSADGAFILTSYAGVSAHGNLPPSSQTEVGQPDNDESSSGCCSNTVAKFATGGPDVNVPTAAVVRLGEDHQWLAEVLEIGAIEDQGSPSRPEVESGTFQVRKYGAATRLTGGTIIAFGDMAGTLPAGVRPDAILVRPNPNPSKPTEDICFSHLIDRGAVLIDDSSRVIGLLYDEIDIPEASGRHVIHGVATPIHIVLNQLNALQGTDVALAITTKIDEVHTASARHLTSNATAMPVPPSRRLDAEARTRLEGLREDLALSPGGRLVVALWNAHRCEVQNLIGRNRKVATVWHRSGGPALLQALTRAGDREPTIPVELNGMPAETCLERIARVFDRYGGEALRSDLARVRRLLPRVSGASLGDILTAIEGI